MLNKLNAKERRHLARVKELACSVCDASAPSEAHHLKQHRQYTCIALCESCHRGPLMGLHGQRRAWAIHKMDETDALDVTIQRLMEGCK
ncbi:hypothetical protein AVMA1855_20090 [Acidovorax sp. SUPP1855]|uniref:hypothetical protein n=1 Tax=Acidovorax sp. SUPP1855 TaxID=431774 RepID=UPI0023DE2A23|nr:hypothetical protein [Acidovorax sp. SUPP1855]GKS86492.1 hypothetical protein AVMA1855_20090 [Acidovorax sp. SUPP1855]